MSAVALLPVLLAVLLAAACGGGLWGLWARRRIRQLRAENAALREGEHRYRRMVEQSGDLVALVDRDGRWRYTSPAYEHILTAADRAVGIDAFRNLHEEDQFRVRGALQVVVRSGEPCRLRMRLHTAGGEIRKYEALVHPVTDEDAQGEGRGIRGAIFVSRDVSGLREREEQLEVAAHAFERMGEAMVITNAAGRVLTINQAFTRITGFAPEDVIGRQERDFHSSMQPDTFLEMYAAVLRNGHWHGNVWCRRRDGTLYQEWRSIGAVRDTDGRVTHFVTLFRPLEGGGAEEQARESPARSA